MKKHFHITVASVSQPFLYLFFLLLGIGNGNVTAQPGFGQPVYKQDFGFGNQNPSTFGIPLPASKTDFPFETTICPGAGNYTILRRVPLDRCFNNLWIELTHDANTTFELGMMMMVNNNPSSVNRVVYKDTVNKVLCPGALYRYSFAVINLDQVNGPRDCLYGPDYPVFEMRLEDDLGNLLVKDTTPPLPSHPEPPRPPSMGYTFTEFGINFPMPAGVNRLVLKLTLLHDNYLCGDDFAVDDIQVRPLGPQVDIQFAGEPTTFVKSVCYQYNPTITVDGAMGAYYPNPSLQWQKSVDGVTWTDIPGETGPVYTRSFSVPDTFLIRLSGGDASTIANPNCRVVSNSLRIEIDGLPVGYTITSNSPVCAGDDLQFSAEGAATYTWTGPNGFSDHIAHPHIFNCSLRDSGMYYVEVYSLGGCHRPDSVRAIIIGTDVHAGPDTAICLGSSVQLVASAGNSYSWTPAEGLSNTNQQGTRSTPAHTTQYTVKVTDSFGCSDTAQVLVTVRNKTEVKAIIDANAYLCRPVDSIQFSSRSEGVLNSWHWNFGNGNNSTDKDPPLQLFLIAPGQYTAVARLAVRDTAGCTDTAFHFMSVEDNCYMAVPTGFTPDNDGVNDYLYPVNAFKARDLYFRIFNRQGEMVFSSRDLYGKWDGKLKGAAQPSGVYVWMLDYTDRQGHRVSLKGTSVLIRKK